MIEFMTEREKMAYILKQRDKALVQSLRSIAAGDIQGFLVYQSRYKAAMLLYTSIETAQRN